MKTHRISIWETWKALGEHYGFDPYKEVNHGIDKGGGNITDYEYIGDIPEKEE